MKVEYVQKQCIYPYFGYAKDGIAYVREDLPKSVQEFVEEHELYHLQDETKNVLLREMKANWAGLRKHPLGGLRCLWMSLSLARLNLYLKRIQEGK
jgi:hypothetical protein